MMVELFCGIFAGSNYGKNIRSWREVSQVANLVSVYFIFFYFQGQCFVAIDPECFAPGFPSRLQDFLNETRSLKPVNLINLEILIIKVDPKNQILIAGDPERLNTQLTKKIGGLVYGKHQLNHLVSLLYY